MAQQITSSETLRIRTARPEDIPAMQRLILDHGANEWNHLSEDEVKAHLASIREGR